MPSSGGPRRERHGGRDYPRRERRWQRLLKVLAVAATVASRGAIGGAGDNLPRHER
jgi:hypothetical protein